MLVTWPEVELLDLDVGQAGYFRQCYAAVNELGIDFGLGQALSCCPFTRATSFPSAQNTAALKSFLFPM